MVGRHLPLSFRTGHIGAEYVLLQGPHRQRVSSVSSEPQMLSMGTGRMEVMETISWGFVNFTLSLYSSVISWAGMGPMTATVS